MGGRRDEGKGGRWVRGAKGGRNGAGERRTGEQQEGMCGYQREREDWGKARVRKEFLSSGRETGRFRDERREMVLIEWIRDTPTVTASEKMRSETVL